MRSCAGRFCIISDSGPVPQQIPDPGGLGVVVSIARRRSAAPRAARGRAEGARRRGAKQTRQRPRVGSFRPRPRARRPWLHRQTINKSAGSLISVKMSFLQLSQRSHGSAADEAITRGNRNAPRGDGASARAAAAAAARAARAHVPRAPASHAGDAVWRLRRTTWDAAGAGGPRSRASSHGRVRRQTDIFKASFH